MNKILEINKRVSKGGRKNIRMILLTIHKDGEMNRNGITWNEEYVNKNLESIKGIPICATFLDEDKDSLFDHGYTETVESEDGKSEPLFLNSESVGVIEDAKIEDIEIDGETKRVLVGYGYIFCQRYPALCTKLETSTVKSSIEIMGKDENDRKIIYDGGYKEKGRVPMEYDFSATALLGVLEADENCYVLEVAENQNKEEKLNMEFTEEMKNSIKEVISEMNDKSQNYETKILELNSTIKTKDAEIAEKDERISELNASVEQIQAALTELEDSQKTWWEERDVLIKELAKAKVAEKIGEMNEALEKYSDEEKEVAKEDIEKLTNEINACEKVDELNKVTSEINSIVNKINSAIVDKQKKALEDAKIAEQNEAKGNDTIDIFSEVNSDNADDSDTNIF
ncbi:hypothetical protein [Eubacterium sp.]|uniref:hypothetical protein n=1 Tax=Eubacterium sp. TaxID=142586 RepID=UPI001DBF720F|nr:hypothetical protein [Eubacterium sp.]MBS5619651.1 hypothetical protein [Eubacterium sp.]